MFPGTEAENMQSELLKSQFQSCRGGQWEKEADIHGGKDERQGDTKFAGSGLVPEVIKSESAPFLFCCLLLRANKFSVLLKVVQFDLLLITKISNAEKEKVIVAWINHCGQTLSQRWEWAGSCKVIRKEVENTVGDDVKKAWWKIRIHVASAEISFTKYSSSEQDLWTQMALDLNISFVAHKQCPGVDTQGLGASDNWWKI